MAKRVTDNERAKILAHLQTGASCNATAKKFGRSTSTISKIARQEGHNFGDSAHSRLARAHEARRAYGAEARAETAAKLHAEANRLLEQLRQQHVAWSFGGRDNVYNEHVFDEPDQATKFTIIRSVATAMKTVLEIDKHDNRASDVDQAAGLIVELVDSLRS